MQKVTQMLNVRFIQLCTPSWWVS